MWKFTALTAALWGSLMLGVQAQQVQPTSSGSNTGSPQAGNTKPVASANPTAPAAPKKPVPGKAANTHTTNATGSSQGGTHNGVKNPGSSARPHVGAANAEQTRKPASGGDAGQGTPGAHDRRKSDPQQPSGSRRGSEGGTK